MSYFAKILYIPPKSQPSVNAPSVFVVGIALHRGPLRAISPLCYSYPITSTGTWPASRVGQEINPCIAMYREYYQLEIRME